MLQTARRFVILGLVLAACSPPSNLEVAEEFTDAFVAGDIGAMEELSAEGADLGAIPWRAEFLAALDLEAESSNCVEIEGRFTCTIVGHNARTRQLVPDGDVRRSLHLTVADGVVTSGSFEFASPELQPVFDEFNAWAFANRRDVIDGPCADLDGTSNPSICAAAVLEVTAEYLAATGG